MFTILDIMFIIIYLYDKHVKHVQRGVKCLVYPFNSSPLMLNIIVKYYIHATIDSMF